MLLLLLVVGACSARPPSAEPHDSPEATETDDGDRGANTARDGSVTPTGVDAGARFDARARDASPPAESVEATPPSDDRGPPGDAGAPSAVLDAAGSDSPSATDAARPGFVLTPVGFPMYEGELTFPAAANPPTNASPEFTWSGVPAGTKSLALVFRDLGNGAVKWVLWDIPPTLMRVPPGISKVAKPAEVPGSSQLGSLDNQGYAGPGSGARQYDFKLWALDVDKLPVSARLTTLQIHDDVLPLHQLATTPPVLLRNTRNLP